MPTVWVLSSPTPSSIVAVCQVLQAPQCLCYVLSVAGTAMSVCVLSIAGTTMPVYVLSIAGTAMSVCVC